MSTTQVSTQVTSRSAEPRRRNLPLWYWIVTAGLVLLIALTAIPALRSHPHSPGVTDFFPPSLFGPEHGTVVNRLTLARIIAAVLICALFVAGAMRAKIVPTRFQQLIEACALFIRDSISIPMLGEKRGRQYAPLIGVFFFGVIAMNITGIVPGINIAASSVIAVPLVFAIFSYVSFIWAGIRTRGVGTFFAEQLLPKGLPKPVYLLITPIEFFSTFIVRPATLAVRLLCNMMSGHLLLALTFFGTSALLAAAGSLKALAAATFAAAIAMTLFEIFVAFLQAYIFATLTAVYIKLSVESH